MEQKYIIISLQDIVDLDKGGRSLQQTGTNRLTEFPIWLKRPYKAQTSEWRNSLIGSPRLTNRIKMGKWATYTDLI